MHILRICEEGTYESGKDCKLRAFNCVECNE